MGQYQQSKESFCGRITECFFASIESKTQFKLIRKNSRLKNPEYCSRKSNLGLEIKLKSTLGNDGALMGFRLHSNDVGRCGNQQYCHVKMYKDCDYGVLLSQRACIVEGRQGSVPNDIFLTRLQNATLQAYVCRELWRLFPKRCSYVMAVKGTPAAQVSQDSSKCSALWDRGKVGYVPEREDRSQKLLVTKYFPGFENRKAE